MDARIVTRGRVKSVTSPCLEPCPIERGMRVLGGKWTGSILWHVAREPIRFNDLARSIPAASKKMIAERLRHLEDEGLLTRHVLETSPVAVEYRVTSRGREAVAALDALREWAGGNVQAR